MIIDALKRKSENATAGYSFIGTFLDTSIHHKFKYYKKQPQGGDIAKYLEYKFGIAIRL